MKRVHAVCKSDQFCQHYVQVKQVFRTTILMPPDGRFFMQFSLLLLDTSSVECCTVVYRQKTDTAKTLSEVIIH